MKRYFITGTDTDCGKTYVTTQLLQYLSNSAALKPIASGCTKLEGQWVNSDAALIQQHNSIAFSLDEINPWRFPLPVSPHIAAREEGLELSVAEIAEYCLNFNHEQLDTLFIEGAGGLLAPITEKSNWLDFLKISKIPVILVVGLKLGCINHALLTYSVLKANKIQCHGWIGNAIDPNMAFRQENINTLSSQLDCPLLTLIDFNGIISGLPTLSSCSKQGTQL